MNKIIIMLLAGFIFSTCIDNAKDIKRNYLIEQVPANFPLDFLPKICPPNKRIHKGVLSPDLEKYYFTISDKNFENFDVFVLEKNNGSWSEAKAAFFNTDYDEHGMSFSPDGKSLYFSSTRPLNIEGIDQTWHIWKSEKVDGIWKEASFVDIPNMRDKLVSHPSITDDGNLYFHSSNLDYSQMDIYHSKQKDGIFSDAQKASISMETPSNKCTPFVSPKEDYLIFASIGKQLDLMISFNDGNGNWINTRRLNDRINHFGQGNPFVTPDNKFLFFTSNADDQKNWMVKWVGIESELKIVN